MAAVGAIRVRGLEDLNRAFERADSKLRRDKNAALRSVAEPVRASAEQFAVVRISNIGPVWSRMRVGVTKRVVYVAPKQRATTRSPFRRRPNLSDLLRHEAMEPALERNRGRVVEELDRFLDVVRREWEK